MQLNYHNNSFQRCFSWLLLIDSSVFTIMAKQAYIFKHNNRVIQKNYLLLSHEEKGRISKNQRRGESNKTTNKTFFVSFIRPSLPFWNSSAETIALTIRIVTKKKLRESVANHSGSLSQKINWSTFSTFIAGLDIHISHAKPGQLRVQSSSESVVGLNGH